MKRYCLSCFILSASLAAFVLNSYGKDASPQEKEDKVVAKVNDVVLRLSDVAILPSPSVPAAPEGTEIPPDEMAEKAPPHDLEVDLAALRPLIEQAVNEELLYQAAKADGLDKDPSFTELAAKQKKQSDWQRTQLLASFLEAQNEDIRKAGDRESVNDKDVDARFEQNPKVFGNLPEKTARMVMRARLAHERQMQVYVPWLQKMVRKEAVTFNGKRVPKDVLSQAVADNFAGITGAKPGKDSGKLWLLFCDAAGIKPEEAKSVGAEPSKDGPVRKAIEEVVIEVGESEFTLNDVSATGGEFGILPVTNEPQLLSIIKTAVLAEIARSKGHEEDPQFLDLLDSVNLVDVSSLIGAAETGSAPITLGTLRDPEKTLLAAVYLKKHGLLDTRAEVSEEEIQAYITKNVGRYSRIEKRPGGKERVKSIVRRQVQQEKAKSAVEKLLQDLRAKAQVQIME